MNTRAFLHAGSLPIVLGFVSVGCPLYSQVLVVGHDGNPVATNSTVNLGNVPQETPTSINFTLGNVRVGNSGALSVAAVTRSGPEAADYAVLTSIPFSIAANGSATLRLRLTPSAAGERRVTLNIKNTGDPNPYAFSIKATAVPTVLQCGGRPVRPVADLTPTVIAEFVEGTILTAEAQGYSFHVGRTAKYFFSVCAAGSESRPGASLCLFNSSGGVVAQDDHACTAGGELTPTLDPGDYVLAISQQAGDYKLSYRLTPLCGGRLIDYSLSSLRMGIRPSTLEGTVTSNLAAGVVIRITGDLPANCVFTLCREGGTATFPTRLCVFDEEGSVLAENDDHCDGKSEVTATLSPGRYLAAVSAPAGPGGTFTLAYFVQAECDGRPVQLVGDLPLAGIPQNLTATLAAGTTQGYRLDSGEFDFVDFSFCADGTGADFDSKICLFKDSGEVLAQDDDTCGLGAHVRSHVLESDDPVVAVTGPGGGNYTLQYLAVAGCESTSEDFQFKADIAPDATKQTAREVLRDGVEHDFRVHAAEDATYVFTFCEAPAASDGNTILFLVDAQGKSALPGAFCGPRGPHALRGPLSAGDYVLCVGHSSGGDAAYTFVYYAEGFGEGRFRRCDFDCSGGLSITDPVATLGFLFLGSHEACCPQVEDCDGSGVVNIGDAVFALTFLFNGGPPPAFFPNCAESGCTGYPCG